jgi:hypothetical protein
VRTPPPITPCEWRHQTEVPDAVPAIITIHALDRDQLLLAKIRHNRLLDLALGVMAYSLGGVRGTEVPGIGAVDVDELYIGLRAFGPPYVVPVLVQRADEPLGAPRLQRVEALCRHHYPNLTPRLVGAQFKPDEDGEVVVLFQLVVRGNCVKLQDEWQYRIVHHGREARLRR